MYYDCDRTYTVRKCIKELRKIGGNVIKLNNGTLIVISEINMPIEEQPFSRIKGEGRIMRRILCRIEPSKKHETAMIDELKKRGYCLYSAKEAKEYGYSYFGENEFMHPERVMNEFIFANDGIDHYATVGAMAYLLADMMDAANI